MSHKGHWVEVPRSRSLPVKHTDGSKDHERRRIEILMDSDELRAAYFLAQFDETVACDLSTTEYCHTTTCDTLPLTSPTSSQPMYLPAKLQCDLAGMWRVSAIVVPLPKDWLP
ncbi:hypothetical protein H257_17424 [Aphanomyces astaci]|uniref:Uncharacterized protein n=1 Tax=Aphanomyces astaci TaxID=112090 RepID=W4FET5_APHAT|nr:hypothetical protein H257_17424 [Aphanomyces astaci]ETV66007.1 hypothetical protein H257_17424 [Aphanomyces astaci]|eukprot:XP_009844526.1 hypothetical protein H257_17424 [Aphanomyces astaci]